MRKLIVSKILPALRVFVYNRGFRPKKGNILFSAPMNIAFRYHDAMKRLKRN